MTEDWRQLCTLEEINTRISVNELKKRRAELKKARCKTEHDEFERLWEIKKLTAIIEGKQWMFHQRYKNVKGFSWSSLGRRK
jgi:hypothetical protein